MPQGWQSGGGDSRQCREARTWKRRPSGLNVLTPRSYSLLCWVATPQAPARRKCVRRRKDTRRAGAGGDNNPRRGTVCGPLGRATRRGAAATWPACVCACPQRAPCHKHGDRLDKMQAVLLDPQLAERLPLRRTREALHRHTRVAVARVDRCSEEAHALALGVHVIASAGAMWRVWWYEVAHVTRNRDKIIMSAPVPRLRRTSKTMKHQELPPTHTHTRPAHASTRWNTGSVSSGAGKSRSQAGPVWSVPGAVCSAQVPAVRYTSRVVAPFVHTGATMQSLPSAN